MFSDAEYLFFSSLALSLLSLVFLGKRVRGEKGITNKLELLTIKGFCLIFP